MAQAAIRLGTRRKRAKSSCISGRPVSTLARELTHFGDIRLTPMAAASHHLEPAQAEALRKMLLSVVSDPRLVLARLARQLVDLNASKDGHAATRERLALETREVFAPLANRLGLWQLKWELEDLAFRFLQPDDYRRIAAALAEKRADRERYITELCRTLEDDDACRRHRRRGVRPAEAHLQHPPEDGAQAALVRAGVRPARGAHRDRAHRGLLRGARAGARPLSRTSRASSTTTSPRPKDNFYRSIHTAVFGPEGKPVEVQIRTREMHDQAELGLAAHWRYKESRAHDVSYDRKIEWVRKLLDSSNDRDAMAIGISSTRSAPSCSKIASTRSRPRARSWTCRPAPRRSTSPITCIRTSDTAAAARA